MQATDSAEERRVWASKSNPALGVSRCSTGLTGIPLFVVAGLLVTGVWALWTGAVGARSADWALR